MNKYINLHAIQSLPPSALNRDDNGSPKKAEFGKVTRVRVSSQSWKYAMREFFSENYDSSYIGCRTTQLPTDFEKALREVRPDADESLVSKMKKVVLAVAEKTSEGEESNADSVSASKMIVFYSPEQLNALVQIATEVVDGKRKTITVADVKESLVAKNTVDLALFGRMMTAVPELSIEAAANVAHVIGVESYKSQKDSFIGIDDSLGKTKIMGSIDFVSSVVYRYACLDFDQLLTNLGGDKKFAIEAAGAFINAFVRSMPSGKQSSFAARTLPSFVLTTISSDQPLSFASAFTSVIDEGDIENEAVLTLMKNADSYFENYGSPDNAFYLDANGRDFKLGSKHPLPELVSNVKKVLSK